MLKTFQLAQPCHSNLKTSALHLQEIYKVDSLQIVMEQFVHS